MLGVHVFARCLDHKQTTKRPDLKAWKNFTAKRSKLSLTQEKVGQAMGTRGKNKIKALQVGPALQDFHQEKTCKLHVKKELRYNKGAPLFLRSCGRNILWRSLLPHSNRAAGSGAGSSDDERDLGPFKKNTNSKRVFQPLQLKALESVHPTKENL